MAEDTKLTTSNGRVLITGRKASGKTVEVIRKAAKVDAYIIVATRKEAVEVARRAREMGEQIRFPITANELMRDGARGLSYPVFVDDIDRVMAVLLGAIAGSFHLAGFSVCADEVPE